MLEPAHLALKPDLVVPAYRTEVVITIPNPRHRIIHVLNVHFVDRESFLADLAHAENHALTEQVSERRYAAFLADLERFQAEQTTVLETCVQDFGVDRVLVEGWTVEDIRLLRLIAETLWRGDFAPVPNSPDDPLRFRWLEFGPSAQLWALGRIPTIEAAESQALLDAASPFDAKGNFRGLLVDAQEEHEDFIVGRLLESGPVGLVVLGGAHHLGDNIRRIGGRTCEYVRVRAGGYDEMCHRYDLE
jgi:hypothetical protein